MVQVLSGLSSETIARLRTLGDAAEDIDWPTQLAKKHGWLVANRAYHSTQRMLGKHEMAELLDALRLQPPLTLELQREVLTAAADIYLRTEQTTGDLRTSSAFLEIDVSQCPIYSRFRDPRGGGFTACGCVGRMNGWHDALGVPAELEMATNRKWGDTACLLRVYAPN